MRTAVLAAIALALTATAVSARPEPVQTVPSLRAQSWNLEIATRRPAMRTRVSHGELKTKNSGCEALLPCASARWARSSFARRRISAAVVVALATSSRPKFQSQPSTSDSLNPSLPLLAT
jgi:hypothetical protein